MALCKSLFNIDVVLITNISSCRFDTIPLVDKLGLRTWQGMLIEEPNILSMVTKLMTLCLLHQNTRVISSSEIVSIERIIESLKKKKKASR